MTIGPSRYFEFNFDDPIEADLKVTVYYYIQNGYGTGHIYGVDKPTCFTIPAGTTSIENQSGDFKWRELFNDGLLPNELTSEKDYDGYVDYAIAGISTEWVGSSTQILEGTYYCVDEGSWQTFE